MDKNLLVVLILIPILIIGGDSYLNSKKRNLEIMALNSGIQEKTDQIGEANDAKQRLPITQDSIKKLKLQYNEISRNLPTAQQAEILIKQSIPIADKWLQFTELSPMTKTRNKMTIKISSGETKVDYDEIKMKMTIKSLFAKLGQYLQELENIQVQGARKLVEVAGLEIKAEPNSEQLLVTMEVKTYTLPEK
ncbi:MAG: hypothetical protein WA705_09275 [Candidatus Ozemobacteraceae bacterium]|jgi:hypothetical protein